MNRAIARPSSSTVLSLEVPDVAQRKTLTAKQVELLRWVAEGCPDGGGECRMAVLKLVHQLRPTAVTAALEHATEGVWIRHGRPSEPRERMFGEPGFELGGRQFCEGELAGGRRVQRHLGADPA